MRWFAALSLAAALAACGESASKGRTPEQDLAVVDNRATAAQYRVALNRIDPRCPEDRRGVADMAAQVQVVLKQGGKDVPLAEILNQIDRAIPAGQTQPCRDIAVSVGVLLQQSR